MKRQSLKTVKMEELVSSSESSVDDTAIVINSELIDLSNFRNNLMMPAYNKVKMAENIHLH